MANLSKYKLARTEIGVAGEDFECGDVIVLSGDGKFYKAKDHPPRKFWLTFEQIKSICKWKHYRVGFQGQMNYSNLKSGLADLGLSDDEIKQCLHP